MAEIYRSTKTVMVGNVRIFAGDTLKIINGWLYITTHKSKPPHRFGLDPNKEFPYGNWKKILEEIDEIPEDSQVGHDESDGKPE